MPLVCAEDLARLLGLATTEVRHVEANVAPILSDLREIATRLEMTPMTNAFGRELLTIATRSEKLPAGSARDMSDCIRDLVKRLAADHA